jgi:hypothetical protein
MESMWLYTTHFTVGEISLNISFFQETKLGGMLGNLKIQTRWFRECIGTGKLSAILKFCWSSYVEEM